MESDRQILWSSIAFLKFACVGKIRSAQTNKHVYKFKRALEIYGGKAISGFIRLFDIFLSSKPCSDVTYALSYFAFVKTKKMNTSTTILKCRPIKIIARWFQAETEFKDHFHKRRLKPKFMIRLTEKKTKLSCSGLSIEKLVEYFKTYDIYDDYIRRRENALKYFKNVLSLYNHPNGYYISIILEYFEAFKFHGLSFRASKLLDPVDQNQYSKEAERLTLNWMTHHLDKSSFDAVIKSQVHRSPNYCYRHIADPHLKSKLQIHFATSFLIDDLLEKEPDKLVNEIRMGLKNNFIHPSSLVQEFVLTVKEIQSNWPDVKFSESIVEWIENIQKIREEYLTYKALEDFLAQRHLDIGTVHIIMEKHVFVL